MKKLRLFWFLVLSILGMGFAWSGTSALNETDIRFSDNLPIGSIALPVVEGEKGINAILVLVQSILLKVVLPLVLVGLGLYIAYELFTAQGDADKMKSAWKSVVYGIIALGAIALSYLIVDFISRLNLV